ncbi:MAG: hypothetical protein ACM3SR_11920 [Ignavibacteriales bacterium]
MEITKPKKSDLVNFRKNDKSLITELTTETDHREWKREKDLLERRLFTGKKGQAIISRQVALNTKLNSSHLVIFTIAG